MQLHGALTHLLYRRVLRCASLGHELRQRHHHSRSVCRETTQPAAPPHHPQPPVDSARCSGGAHTHAYVTCQHLSRGTATPHAGRQDRHLAPINPHTGSRQQLCDDDDRRRGSPSATKRIIERRSHGTICTCLATPHPARAQLSVHTPERPRHGHGHGHRRPRGRCHHSVSSSAVQSVIAAPVC